MNREELVALVLKITQAEGSEAEIDRMIELLEQNVPHPAVSDLVFYPDSDRTADEIVDRALSYKPLTAPRRSRLRSGYRGPLLGPAGAREKPP